MNRTWRFYDLQTGLMTPARLSLPDGSDAVAANTPDGHEAIEGEFDHLSQRVDLATGEVVDYQPPAPSADAMQTWAWNDSHKRWVGVPTLAALKQARTAPVLAAMAALEEKQARPLRDVMVAQLTGAAPAAADVTRLQELKASVDAMRSVVTQIAAAASVAELDLIAWP